LLGYFCKILSTIANEILLRQWRVQMTCSKIIIRFLFFGILAKNWLVILVQFLNLIGCLRKCAFRAEIAHLLRGQFIMKPHSCEPIKSQEILLISKLI
jgi:hypothetical protein